VCVMMILCVDEKKLRNQASNEQAKRVEGSAKVSVAGNEATAEEEESRRNITEGKKEETKKTGKRKRED
jgi:hypothetical protein